MAKAIAILLGMILFLIISIGASLIGMIYGWGIEPKNWWIIALSYVGVFGATVFKAIVDSIVEIK